LRGRHSGKREEDRSLARLARARRVAESEYKGTISHRPAQTNTDFFPANSAGKNSQRFAKELPNNRIKARLVGREVAQDLFNRGLSLPSGTAMTEEDPNRVIDAILGCRR